MMFSRRVTWLLVGLMLGAILSVGVPAQGGGPEQTIRRLAKRITKLNNRVNTLQVALSDVQTQLSSLSDVPSRLSQVESDIGKLKSKTLQLDSSGNYTGVIGGNQVATPTGCSGQAAVWSGFLGNRLDC